MNERIHAARQVNQDKAADRAWSRDAAKPTRDEIFTKFLGQLNRDGQTVYYINLRNGKTKEGHPSVRAKLKATPLDLDDPLAAFKGKSVRILPQNDDMMIHHLWQDSGNWAGKPPARAATLTGVEFEALTAELDQCKALLISVGAIKDIHEGTRTAISQQVESLTRAIETLENKQHDCVFCQAGVS